MSITKVEKTGEYIGQSVSGQAYLIIEFTEFIDVTTFSDTETKWRPNFVIYKLPNGEPVSHIEGNIYEIVRNGDKVTLTRVL
jgi:hypothetical protein